MLDNVYAMIDTQFPGDMAASNVDGVSWKGDRGDKEGTKKETRTGCELFQLGQLN